MTMNQHQPLISIIIAVFNGASTLPRCLDSIRAQHFRDFEVVVMDGGSKDETPQILAQYDDLLDYWESEPDRGIYHAWNKALSRARGEWVLFLGADDELHDPSALADMAPYLGSGRDRWLVYGKLCFIGGRFDGQEVGCPWTWSKFRRRMTLPHPATFHRRGLYETFGTYDERYRISADYELLLRVKDRLDPLFVNRLVTKMAAEGTSSQNREKSLAEAYLAQRANHVASRLVLGFWHLYYRARLRLETAKGA